MEIVLPRHFASLFAAVLAMAVLPSGAHAHTVRAAITCGSVTFTWSGFDANGQVSPVNAPLWSVAVAPNPIPIAAGQVPFPGSGTTFTTAIPPVNGDVTAASLWTPITTRDGVAGGGSTTTKVTDCTALSSTASADIRLGGEISDVAHLRGVTADATGSITFRLYAGADAACATALSTAAVAVSGPGDYSAPPFRPSEVGGYHWTTEYSGDAKNKAVGPVGCDDPLEHVDVTPAPVPAASTPAAPVPVSDAAPAEGDVCVSAVGAIGPLRGVPHLARRAFTARFVAAGVTRVTFYLNGRKLVTLTPKDALKDTYRVRIDPKRLNHNAQRLRVVALSSCGEIERRRTFLRARTALARPNFTG